VDPNPWIPSHPAQRQRLVTGALLALAVGLLNLVPLSLWLFAAPWPLALVWMAAGWAQGGVQVVPAVLVALTGLFLDAVTGGPAGAWAFVGLAAYGLTLVQLRMIGPVGSPVLQALLSALAAFVAGSLLGLLRGDFAAIPGLVLPCLLGAVLYPLVETIYRLDQDRER
jgi:FtsH-binding integral membrane protein